MKIPAISQHLRKLKDAFLVSTTRVGTVIYYQVSDNKKELLKALLDLRQGVGQITN